MAQVITITVDDITDSNAIPDLLTALNYPGGGTAATKSAFIKAWLIQQIKDKIILSRINMAASIAANNNGNIPIT